MQNGRDDMDCDKCNHGSPACERVRTINGFAGSMDCDKTPEKVRWAINTLNIQGWAIGRFRVLIDMAAAHEASAAYLKEQRDEIDAALKEQWGKCP